MLKASRCLTDQTPITAPFVLPWHLTFVFYSLQKSYFESIRELPLGDLYCKVVFMVTITSIRHVSELAAHFCKVHFLILHKDKWTYVQHPPFYLRRYLPSISLKPFSFLPCALLLSISRELLSIVWTWLELSESHGLYPENRLFLSYQQGLKQDTLLPSPLLLDEYN